MKYDIDSAKNIFLEKGLTLDENKYINDSTNMKCHDVNGYYYSTSINKLSACKRPDFVNKHNPYSINNINQFFINNNCETRIIDKQYINSKTRMNFICGNCGGIFEATWNDIHNGKRYCNYCAKSLRYDGLKDYTKLVKEYCEQNGYQLLTDYIHRSFDDFEYICLKHKDYGIQHSYYDRMINGGQGCYLCGVEKRGAKHRKSESEYEELAMQKGFMYKGCTYPMRNNGCKKAMLQLICNQHVDKGIQNIDYQNLKRNIAGCIYCHGFYQTREDVQNKIDKMNMDISILNYRDYTDIDVLCKKCGYKWNTTGVNLSQGHGCPSCCFSTLERSVANTLKEWGYGYIPQYIFDDCKDKSCLPFDFYLYDFNTIIEVDGEQHYHPVNFRGTSDKNAIDNYLSTIKHDKIKNQYCINNNINIIRLPYWEFEDDTYLYHLFDSFVENGIITI